MGVYIKGMKMPTRCDDCFLPLQYCPYAMKPNGECPLIPVPPHGDLIDRDALYKSYGASGNCNKCDLDAYKCQYYNEHTMMEFCELIDDAPTIIEAEEGE